MQFGCTNITLQLCRWPNTVQVAVNKNANTVAQRLGLLHAADIHSHTTSAQIVSSHSTQHVVTLQSVA